MKIIILSPSNSSVGGVERFCNYLDKVYSDAGHEVVVLYNKKRTLLGKIFSKIGLGSPYLGFVTGNLAKEEGFDLLITNGSLGWNIKKRNIINIQHGTFAASADRIDKGINFGKWFVKKYIWGYFEQLAASRAGYVVAVSDETAKSVKKYYHIKDVLVIANTIDFDLFSKKDKILSRQKFSLPEDKKLAFFAGRFEYGKGSDVIEASLSEVIKAGANIVVASNNLINLPGIISLNNLSYSDLPILYSACDLFIFPTRHEGASLALIEAMACDLPFLVTNVGSVSEIIKESPIFANRVSSLDEFTENLVLRLNNANQDNYHERVIALKLFSYQNFSARYLSLLNDIK